MLKSKKSSKKTDQDLHRLVGQVLDHRLRVLKLNFVSPRQWLYEAEPPSVGKTRRALKVLGQPEGREPGSFYRLNTYCERVKSISSDFIEKVYETGLLHDLTPYILTEWLPYPSLYEHLRQRQVQKKGPLNWEETYPLFVQVLHALDALHQNDLTHGDLRAQHILLKKIDHPILIDGGVSSAFGSPPSPGLDKSLAYWAPERLTFAAATPATDFYSLGILLYVCLHGYPPFTFSTDLLKAKVESPIEILIEKHQNSPPPPLKVDVPPHIHGLYLKLLAKEPHQRPANVAEIFKLLDSTSPSSLSPEDALIEYDQNHSLDIDDLSLIETLESPVESQISVKKDSSKKGEQEEHRTHHALVEESANLLDLSSADPAPTLNLSSNESTQLDSSISFPALSFLSLAGVLCGIGLAYLL